MGRGVRRPAAAWRRWRASTRRARHLLLSRLGVTGQPQFDRAPFTLEGQPCAMQVYMTVTRPSAVSIALTVPSAAERAAQSAAAACVGSLEVVIV